MKKHTLKSMPEFFQPILDGVKQFEIRNNDREFRVGDTLWLREWDHVYTGRDVLKVVTYITTYRQQVGYVVMGIRNP